MALIQIYYNPEKSPALKSLVEDLRSKGLLSEFGREALLNKVATEDLIQTRAYLGVLENKLDQILALLNNGVQINPDPNDNIPSAEAEEPVETMGFVDFTV